MNDPADANGHADFFDELGRFNAGYQADQGQRPGLEALPDGAYDLVIDAAEPSRTPEKRIPILRLDLRVTAGPRRGQVVERTYFLDAQEKVNRLGGDLQSLGFDSDAWTDANGRPFNRELASAVSRLPGVAFRGAKTSRPEVLPVGVNAAPRTFHNLRVLAVYSGPADAPPGRAALTDDAFDVPAPSGASAAGAAGGDDVPF